MKRALRPVDSLSVAVTLQQRADALALNGYYSMAATLFDEAAQFAITQQGIACLLAKANEARAHISGVSA